MKILVIDDDVISRKVITHKINESLAKAHVDTFIEPKLFYESDKVKDILTYDAIISDYTFPTETCIPFLKYLKEEASYTKLIIVLSGDEEEEIIENLSDYPNTKCFNKQNESFDKIIELLKEL